MKKKKKKKIKNCPDSPNIYTTIVNVKCNSIEN